jgi:hypothetical protein
MVKAIYLLLVAIIINSILFYFGFGFSFFEIVKSIIQILIGIIIIIGFGEIVERVL